MTAPERLRSPSRTLVRQLAVAAIVLVGGTLLRLYGLSASLWLDELGSLWAADGDLATVLRKTAEFQGVTAIYAVMAWVVSVTVGVSEVTLRLPSILAWLVYSGFVVGVTRYLANGLAIPVAAVLSASSVTLAIYSATARPYMLALAFQVAALYFLTRVRGSGRRADGLAFGLFTGLTVLTHYFVAVSLAGAFLVLLVSERSRGRYSVRDLSVDALIAAALSTIAFPQIVPLLQGGRELNWLAEPAWTMTLGMLGPYVLPAILGIRRLTVSTGIWLWLAAIVAPIITVSIAQLVGVTLVHPRYALGALPPLMVLAAVGLSRGSSIGAAAGAVCVALNVVGFQAIYSNTQTFTAVYFQDWRAAGLFIRQENRNGRADVLLYRSGFVEQDQTPRGRRFDFDAAPLRYPGQGRLAATVVPLTYRWAASGRQQYFDQIERDVLTPGKRLIFVSPTAGGDTDYRGRVLAWIRGKSNVVADVRCIQLEGLALFVADISQAGAEAMSDGCRTVD